MLWQFTPTMNALNVKVPILEGTKIANKLWMKEIKNLMQKN